MNEPAEVFKQTIQPQHEAKAPDVCRQEDSANVYDYMRIEIASKNKRINIINTHTKKDKSDHEESGKQEKRRAWGPRAYMLQPHRAYKRAGVEDEKMKMSKTK